MEKRQKIETFLLNQCQFWKGLEIADLLKALHQSVFGGGHLIPEDSETRLREELLRLPPDSRDRGIEPLDGPFCRFHLAHLRETGLSVGTLNRLFRLSGESPCGSAEELEEKLEVLLGLARAGALPFSAEETERAVENWRAAGFPACHHSEAVRGRYAPAYRVIRREFLWMLPLLAAVDRLLERKGGGIVAIEGGSASGKTTLASRLEQLYDCQVFHMDDFFLRPEQRTEARLAEPGGNVDRERFLEEVLLPVTRRETVRLRVYDCHSQTVGSAVERPFRPLTFVEGAYSMHPELAEHYDLSAFLSISPETQRARLRVRNTPEMQERFLHTWIPLEQRYFEAARVKERCGVILEVDPCRQ